MPSPSAIVNRPGPDCELTIRLKFPSLDRFREDYHAHITHSKYFLKTTRSKPPGTRVQLIFVIEDPATPMEIWSWGSIEKIISAEEAAMLGENAGLEIKLMDITSMRRQQIEALFGVDEAVLAIAQRHSQSPQPQADPKGATGYLQAAKSGRQDLIERVEDMLRLAETADHYVLLGIAKDAKDDEIRDAYRLRSKEFHPDQYFRKIPDDLLATLQKAFQKIADAYRILLDPKRRLSYDSSIGNYSNPNALHDAQSHVQLQKKFVAAYQQIVASRNPMVQKLFQSACDDAARGELKIAHKNLKIALSMDPLNPELKKKLQEVEQAMAS